MNSATWIAVAVGAAVAIILPLATVHSKKNQ